MLCQILMNSGCPLSNLRKPFRSVISEETRRLFDEKREYPADIISGSSYELLMSVVKEKADDIRWVEAMKIYKKNRMKRKESRAKTPNFRKGCLSESIRLFIL